MVVMGDIGLPGDIAHLLGHLLAHPDGNLLVVDSADLLGHLLALGDGLALADLVRNLVALLSVHIVTLVHGVALACAGDDSPDLLTTRGVLPVILTVLLVRCYALSLGVWLQHRLVLVPAHLLVLRIAHLILHQMALLPGGVLTQSLALHLAQLLIHGLAGLVGLLHIVSVPDGDILHPTLDTAVTMTMMM